MGEGTLYGCTSLKELSIPFVGGSAATKVENGYSTHKGYSSQTYVFGYIFGWYKESAYTSSNAPSGTVYQGYGYYDYNGSSYNTGAATGTNSYYSYSTYYADYS